MKMQLNLGARLRTFITNSRHVLNISYKPTRDEFNRSAKIILIGILLVGFIGFIIALIISFITGNPL